MDASDFNSSRVYKEQSLDLVSKTCAELGTVDERLYLAYAERGISRIQDNGTRKVKQTSRKRYECVKPLATTSLGPARRT